MKASLIHRIGFVGLTVAIAALGYQPVIQAMPATEPATTFIGSSGHEVMGSAQIIEVEGQRYLELDAAFSSDDGPDLFVLLHREAIPQTYEPASYVNLGRLQAVAGSQRYAIPAEVTLQDFKSAVIWCRDFDVTFGYVML